MYDSDVECDTCSKKFCSQRAADQHMAARGHWANYCKDCKRHFGNANSLRMHLNSRMHRGTGIACPFCKNKFTTATGVTHHLETGSCPNAKCVNRDSILNVIRQRDRSGYIVNKQIEWHDERGDYFATNQAYNGNSWECYLCHRGFKSQTGLNQHINSPIHKQKAYHCPNTKARCGKEFTALAALFNHLESGSCSFMRFETVQSQVHDVLSGRKLIGFQ